MDPLGLQGLDPDAAQPPRLLTVVPPRADRHGLIDVGVCPGVPAKLPLHVCLTLDHYEVASLFLCPVGDPG